MKFKLKFNNGIVKYYKDREMNFLTQNGFDIEGLSDFRIAFIQKMVEAVKNSPYAKKEFEVIFSLENNTLSLESDSNSFETEDMVKLYNILNQVKETL